MLAKTPPMGWNSWNTFGPDINEKVVLETADAIVNLGLDKLGYEYVVIDDIWSLHDRDPETDEIVANPEKFPHGMKYVADYVHSKGLKFGMYSCAGVKTCGGFPGSYDHEFLDAQTFANFGVDFLKYDFCNMPANANGPMMYKRMGLALKTTGREILFSACNWGVDDVWSWIRSTGAHMYRSTGDIGDSFGSAKEIFLSQENKYCYSGPACFNDMDMLTVGMYGKGLVGNSYKSTLADYRTQFSIWCMFGSPLMLGCDLRSISEECLALIKNKDLLRINQDEEARSPMIGTTTSNSSTRVYFKHLSNNEYALSVTNLSDEKGGGEVMLEDFGLTYNSRFSMEFTNIFTGEKRKERASFWTELEAHDTAVFLAKIVK